MEHYNWYKTMMVPLVPLNKITNGAFNVDIELPEGIVKFIEVKRSK